MKSMENLRQKIKIILEQYNSYKDFVMAAQEKLIALGYDLGPFGADGVIGKFTRKSIRDFQLKNGGNGKGNLGPWTAKKLGIEYYGGGKTDSSTTTTTPTPTTEPQNCSRFQVYDGVEDTRNQVCKGQTKNVGTGSPGCSQYVREKTGAWQGNAWHAYRLKNSYPNKVDGFRTIFTPENQKKMAEIFQKINSQSSGLNESGIQSSNTWGDIKSLINSAVPDQSSFSQLKLGDVVGIYYPSSQHHGEAFFQGATGLGSNGETAHNGPYFRVDLGNGKSRPWEIGDIGKNVKIIPGNGLKQGDRFGFNTHLGFVGAKDPKGEPIIYHSVNGTVNATPLSKMGGNFKLVWARPKTV
jgi:peptidoglycan hydrolase-like protein with peptidoglycan-binding domain